MDNRQSKSEKRKLVIGNWQLPIDHCQLAIAALALLALLLYLGATAVTGALGFPLDDAWIHHTYARNFAGSGQWEYLPGAASAGSTAPLWTLLLALGYLLRLPYLGWSYLLGFLCLLWLALAAMRLWRQLWPAQAGWSWLPGVVLVLTWPLVWAAVSGMETLLFAALGMQLLALYGAGEQGSEELRVNSQQSTVNSQQLADERPTTKDEQRTPAPPLPRSPAPLPLATRHSHTPPAWLGFIAGLLILARPDGLILLLLLAVGLWLRAANRWRPWPTAVFLLAAALPLLPYFAFNLWSSGQLWPNTFYAKQAEYAALLARPLLPRLAELLYFSLGGPESGWRGISGAHWLLLPGLLAAGWTAVRRDWQARRLWQTLPLLWAGGHILLYAWRLPVTYQHGRYLWAALPVWILFGLAGWRWLLAHNHNGPESALRRLGRRVASLTFALLLLIFLLLGAQVYATDVAFIEGEMVTVAHWLAAHTAPDDLIAAHDIGAIGYFAQRPLLDLAGLISPEIIPYLHDEPALAAYVRRSGADYLVTAPGWPYPSLTTTAVAEPLYSTDYAWTRQQGLNNMTVYRLSGR